MIDLLNEGAPELLRQAVCACYQETPTPFRDYVLHDPGAWPEPPLEAKITWMVRRPELEPKSEEDRSARQRPGIAFCLNVYPRYPPARPPSMRNDTTPASSHPR